MSFRHALFACERTGCDRLTDEPAEGRKKQLCDIHRQETKK